MTFKARPDREIQRIVDNDPQIELQLRRKAKEGARLLDARLPGTMRHRGARVVHGVRRTATGTEGFFGVESPFWHLFEYGTFDLPPRGYLRSTGVRMFGRNWQESKR